MKVIKFSIIIFALILTSFQGQSQCNAKLVDIAVGQNRGATYLKDFRVKLPAAQKGKPKPIARFKVMLNSGTHYRFNVAKAQEFQGVPIIQLYEGKKLLGTSYLASKDKDFKMFDFICTKTTTYELIITFKDGKAGCAVAVMSLVRD
jgi:hypothetical protein